MTKLHHARATARAYLIIQAIESTNRHSVDVIYSNVQYINEINDGRGMISFFIMTVLFCYLISRRKCIVQVTDLRNCNEILFLINNRYHYPMLISSFNLQSIKWCGFNKAHKRSRFSSIAAGLQGVFSSHFWVFYAFNRLTYPFISLRYYKNRWFLSKCYRNGLVRA